MTLNKVKAVERILFILMIVCLPFNHFPVKFPIAGNDLANVCILLGLVTVIYEILCFRTPLERMEKYILAFIGISILWLVISSIHGLLIYPYEIGDYSFSRVYLLLKSILDWCTGGGLSEDAVKKIALSFNIMRSPFGNVLFTYFIIFYTYHIYKSDGKKGFYDAGRAVIILVSCMAVYSLFEVGYLLGNETCKAILKSINPFFMQLNISGSWWPPILWAGQVRSLFAEPSFLGICSAMFFPFLAYYSVNGQKWRFGRILLFFLFTVMVFLTRSRTAVVIMLAELLLFAFPVFLQKTISVKKFAKLLLLVAAAFCVSLFLLSHFANTPKHEVTKAEVSTKISSYVEENVTSAVGTKRSNNARHAESLTRLRIGLEHPVFGVGQGLDTQYVVDNFTEEDLENYEVRQWCRGVTEDGPLKVGIGSFNYLAYLICTEGMPGLILFLSFPFYFAWHYLRNLKKLKLATAILGISYMGSLAALFSNSPFASLYILSGLLLCFINYNNLN